MHARPSLGAALWKSYIHIPPSSHSRRRSLVQSDGNPDIYRLKSFLQSVAFVTNPQNSKRASRMNSERLFTKAAIYSRSF